MTETRSSRIRARRRAGRVRRAGLTAVVLGTVAGLSLIALPATALVGTGPAPAKLVASVQGGDRQIVAAWRRVPGATGYVVRMEPAAGSAVVRRVPAGARATVIGGLPNGRRFSVQVAATGAPAASAALPASTSAGRPLPVSAVRVQRVSRYRLLITWAGGGPATRVAVAAGSTPSTRSSHFSSGWRVPTTRSIRLAVPWSLRHAFRGNARVFVRVVQANAAEVDRGAGALAAVPAPAPVTAPAPTPGATVPDQHPDPDATQTPSPAPSSAGRTTTPPAVPTPTTTSAPVPTASARPTAPTSASAPATPTAPARPSAPASTTAPAPAPVDPPPAGAPAFRHLVATDFGAVGDGRTDDQSALAAAVGAAKAAGAPLYLPPGRYSHSGRIALDGVVLYGSSASTTELHGTTANAHSIDLTGVRPGIVNLMVSGPGRSPRSSLRGGNGVYVDHAVSYLVRNVHIADVPGAGVMVENSSGGVERNNLVERTGADGMYHTEGTHDVEVAYNRTVTTGDDGISVTTYGADTHDIDIHHNSVLGNFESRAITVNGTSGGVVIRDNHIDGGTAGVSCTSHSGWSGVQTSGVQVYGNTIRDINQSRHDTGTIGGGAISFWNDNGGVDRGTTVHDNQIYRSGLFGIYVGGGSEIDAAVTGNHFYTDGTLLRSDNPRAGIDRSGTTVSPVSAYPGDVVPSTIGGLDPDYHYQP